MLTFDKLESHMKRSLEGATILDEGITLLEVANFAGRWFMGHPWEFRERPAIRLTPLVGVDHIFLPDDFGNQTTYQMSDGLNFGITFTTLQQISHLRATTVVVSQNYYWAAVAQPSQPNQNQPMPPPRLELWPTPSATPQADLVIGYKAKWVDLTDSDNAETPDVCNIPDYAEMAMIQCARAFAVGWAGRLSDGEVDVETQLQKLVNGMVWRMLLDTDGSVQTDYGIMMGGAIQTRYPSHTWRSASASPVSNPS